MQDMRELLRSSLARSLRTLTEEDRLAAALPVVCGSALASHCVVEGLDETRTLRLRVDKGEWLSALLGMRDVLQRDLARTAGVPLHGIIFEAASPRKPYPQHGYEHGNLSAAKAYTVKPGAPAADRPHGTPRRGNRS